MRRAGDGRAGSGTIVSCLHCEIGAINTRFARGLDHDDVDSVMELFTDDAVYDNGRVHLEGLDELRAWFTERAAAAFVSRTTRHVWSALHLERIGDDQLRAESTWVTYAANQRPPVDFVAVSAVADFVDELRMVDGRWLISRREIRVVFRDAGVAPPV
jgi:3-phenylpropionate/cinnamic acid dioxygenase small subunit